jgi:hypothetical protein
MIGDEAKAYVFLKSKIIFHIVLFLAFFGAIQLHPWVVEQAAVYITQYTWLQSIVPWIVTYLIAIYIFPAIAFMIVKAVLDR